ncbi:LANO_0G06810g1_1 [Lachancea nothofagi CBS 11611]|uniref:LANO_0G06810g1_1 n=1 Tax=Lachancea nothofagi CBS 11611 TaxID=1266666 RepID=A0A1G4KH53_9SACH|nr:LANO_0G06810g1_1 [Lachancea nothofagi CBS 11611]
MANKRRPKKIKAPYRKYVAGQGFVHTRGFTSASDAVESISRGNGDIVETPQGSFYYDLDTESIVQLEVAPQLPSQENNQTNADGKYTGDTVLPWEIFDRMLRFCDKIEPQFLLVCRRWYYICVPLLYASPKLQSRNFSQFVDAVINNRKKRLGENVLDLDLSHIIQSGKNSYVSKLLRRCSPKMRCFTAPQTSFGYAPLISLKSCRQLQYLDLGLVSETVQLGELFSAIKEFACLTHLSFPRSSIDCAGFRDFEWPPNLRYLKLSGGITNEFVMESKFPRTIRTLEFSFCPQINEHSVYMVLARIGDFLKHLYFHYPMPTLHESSLDFVFRYCSNLITLQLTVDYCSKWAFSENMLTPLPTPRPLRTLLLECSGNLGQSFKVHPDDITIALAEERLPNLNTVRVSSKLGWDMKGSDVGDLISCLEDQDGSLYINY